jgi:ribosomal protein S18 acetylase RimI-like enzyme
VEYQEFLEELCEKEQCRTFVRASGTENVVRLYVECKDASKLESIYEILEKEIIQEYGFLDFSAKGGQFLQRRLALEDMNNQYFELLGMLSSMDASKVQPEQCGKIVASGTLLVEEKILRNFGKVGHIEDIVVHCDYRKYGLGKKMIQSLTALSEQNGCYKTILDCSEENAGFYEKCEYNRKGVAMGKYV